MPEAFITANEAIFTLGELQQGETILIHAGASGVGTAAIQLAHQVNANIYTTISSAERKAKVLELGATAAINYKQYDFAVEMGKLIQDKGIDVIIDFVGADYFTRNLQLLNPGGRLICVGLMGGTKAEISLDRIVMHRLQIKGLIMRKRSIAEKRAITQRFSKPWMPSLAERKIHPVIDSIFPLSEVQKAHERMESNANIGKIILKTP